MQQHKRIAIQGYEGSFHQEAARQFFGPQVEVLPCATFREVARLAASKKESDGGIMAIENSIAGSILPNYSLLKSQKLCIVGEVHLQIKQQLLAFPGVSLHDVKEVHSHPMALLQCMAYLEKYPHWKLVETEDTALSAKHLQQYKRKHTVAIASKLAAQLFGLQVLAPNIHTMKHNYTRFLVLQRPEVALPDPNANKASINFATDHSKGSLAKVLTIVAEAGINLSKLQSMPIPGTHFKYSFHADLEFESRENLDAIIEKLNAYTLDCSVLGIYKNGKTTTI
ncbi:MAG: chorismate mutase [Bacteroidetes bacterium]|nr:MAG: chorismate mutase [Bacteroidota bacterium]